MEATGSGYLTDEPMAHMGARVSRAETASQSSVGATRESDGGFNFSDADFDFPPTMHPGRELFTFSLFILLIMTLAIWGGWKLISLI